MSERTHRGQCFCGDVVVEVTGDPVLQIYCHCPDCRGWLGAPIHAATGWPAQNVRVVAGESQLGAYAKTDRSHRRFCTRCGGPVMNEHPADGIVDVMASVLRDFPFAPTAHVHYLHRVLRVKDGLPKYRDFPAEFGGSGETLPE